MEQSGPFRLRHLAGNWWILSCSDQKYGEIYYRQAKIIWRKCAKNGTTHPNHWKPLTSHAVQLNKAITDAPRLKEREIAVTGPDTRYVTYQKRWPKNYAITYFFVKILKPGKYVLTETLRQAGYQGYKNLIEVNNSWRCVLTKMTTISSRWVFMVFWREEINQVHLVWLIQPRHEGSFTWNGLIRTLVFFTESDSVHCVT